MLANTEGVLEAIRHELLLGRNRPSSPLPSGESAGVRERASPKEPSPLTPHARAPPSPRWGEGVRMIGAARHYWSVQNSRLRCTQHADGACGPRRRRRRARPRRRRPVEEQHLLQLILLDQLAHREPAAQLDRRKLLLAMHPRRRAGGEGKNTANGKALRSGRTKAAPPSPGTSAPRPGARHLAPWHCSFWRRP